MADASDLQRIAEHAGACVRRRWGSVSSILPPTVDLDDLRVAAEANGYDVVGSFGADDVELSISGASPADQDIHRLLHLAGTPGDENRLGSAANGWVIAAEVLNEELRSLEVWYRRLNWCSDVETLRTLMSDDWLVVAENIVEGTVYVGDVAITLERLLHDTNAPILGPVSARPESLGVEQEVWDAFASLADAAAWRCIAVQERRDSEGLRLALHSDQSAVIPVAPRDAGGGVQLLKWLLSAPEGDRAESLRHVLRLVTANSTHLPPARTVQTLAERQRMALSRERAADVQRAISEGRARTSKALAEASSELAKQADDTVRAVQATVLAAIGVVAFTAEHIELLPRWLLLLVAAVALAGIIVLLLSRWRRVGELGDAVQEHQQQLEDDPLLPADDRCSLINSVKGFDVQRKVGQARFTVCSLGALATSVVVVATGWLVFGDSNDERADAMIVREGFVLVRGRSAELCSELGPGTPPSCVGDRHDLLSFDVGTSGLLTREMRGVVWTDQLVRVAGTSNGEAIDVVIVSP